MRVVLSIIFLLVTVTKTVPQVCKYGQSVELINRSFNGIIYQDGEYFTDDTGVERGCVCKKEICARKCCPFGQGYDETQKQCVDLPDKFDPPVFEGSRVKPEFNITNGFHYIFYKMNCSKEKDESRLFLADYTDEYHLRTDGKLFFRLQYNIPSDFVLSPDKYCIDNFLPEDNITKLNALVCFVTEKQENHYGVSATCMVISCFFIILTVGVYAFLPELRTTVHGKVMMAYLSSIFVGFLFLATMQFLLLVDNITQTWCTVMTFVIYFSILAGFFWLNVMCYDLWWKFKSINVTTHGYSNSDRNRFLRYSAYAFGVPTILTILLAILEFSGLPKDNRLLPNIRRQGCFIDGYGKLIYLYSPMLVLCVANLVFFALVARRIKEIKKQTQRVKTANKQQLSLYIKLFIIAGINWVLEVISALFPQIDNFWQFTDAYNVLVGVIFFIIFVCKKKIFIQLKQRYRQLFGQPPSSSESKATTSTAPSTQSRDDLQMKSQSSLDNTTGNDK